MLMEGHRMYGNKWTEIAKMVGGRTDNAVKVCDSRGREEEGGLPQALPCTRKPQVATGSGRTSAVRPVLAGLTAVRAASEGCLLVARVQGLRQCRQGAAVGAHARSGAPGTVVPRDAQAWPGQPQEGC